MIKEDSPRCHESIAADGAPIGAQTTKLCSVYFVDPCCRFLNF
ncbi:hypothetical protein LINGRAHAP2_LOCUS23191 [Linum grandiflorum]